MLSTGKLNVIHELKFNSIYAEISNKDFCALGFALGDSLDVIFSNGFRMDDVPYYDGFYVKTGQYIVSGYPSYPYVSVGMNNRAIWPVAGLRETGETVEIVLHEKGKYLATQEAFSQKHPPDRSYYVSDEAFANFRCLEAPNIREGFFIRGGSPVCDDFGFMKTADDLIRRHGVRFVLDLADNDEELAESIKACEGFYIGELYREGRIVCLDLSANPLDPVYAQKLCGGFREMLRVGEGPVYFHCVEGKDRTGFCSILLMALGDGGYAEFEKDYMMTYQNFYYIDREHTPEKYRLIRDLYLDGFNMNFLCRTEDETDFSGYDFYRKAVEYLRFGGMTEDEIRRLIVYVRKEGDVPSPQTAWT